MPSRASLYLPPYRTFRAPPPPSGEALQDECSRLVQLFERRNTDLRRAAEVLYSAYALHEELRGMGETLTWLDDFVLRLSVPWTLLNRYTALMTAGKPVIRVRGLRATKEGERQADSVEALIRRYRWIADRDFRASGSAFTLDAFRARQLFVYGHCYQIVLLNPARKSLPIWTDVPDATTVYPVFGNGGVRRVYYSLRLSVEEARLMWGADVLPDADPEEMRDVWWYADDYYVVVFEEGGNVIVGPVLHEMGRCPVIATFVNGETGTFSSGHQDAYRLSAMGRPAIWPVLSELEHYSKLTEAATYATIMNAVPPLKKRRGASLMPYQVDLTPGGKTELDEGADVEYLVNPAALPGLQMLLEQSWRRIQAHLFTIDPTAFREQTPSGFAADVANKSERVYFYAQYTAALAGHIERESELVLSCLRRHAPILTVADVTPSGEEVLLEIDPTDIPEEPELTCTIRMYTIPDLLQLSVVGVQATGGPVISAETYQREVLQLDDPRLERSRMMEEMIDRNPLTIKTLQPGYDILKMRRLAQEALSRGAPDDAQVWTMMAFLAEQQLEQAAKMQALSAILGPQAGQPAGQQQEGQLPEGLPVGAYGAAANPVRPDRPPPGQAPVPTDLLPPGVLGNPSADPVIQMARSVSIEP